MQLTIFCISFIALPLISTSFRWFPSHVKSSLAPNKFHTISIKAVDSERSSSNIFSSGFVQHTNVRNSDEDDEEGEAPVAVFDEAPMSMEKEGINFASSLNGSDVRVGIIRARWNADVIQGLYEGVNQSLADCGVKPSNVFVTYVPGAFELPITARFLAASKRVDVIICLGCLIKGDTMHFEYIAQATANGIMQVAIESYVPCIFGVLTVLNKEQAVVRSTGAGNEGLSWGKSAVEMGLARMSALGFDKPKGAEKQTPFVSFNGTLPSIDKSGNTTKPSIKRFF